MKYGEGGLSREDPDYIYISSKYLVCPKDLAMVNVVLVTVLGSCSSPYILLNKALLSSINVSIALVGKEFPDPVQESWLRRITQGRSRITFPPPLSASMHRI